MNSDRRDAMARAMMAVDEQQPDGFRDWDRLADHGVPGWRGREDYRAMARAAEMVFGGILMADDVIREVAGSGNSEYVREARATMAGVIETIGLGDQGDQPGYRFEIDDDNNVIQLIPESESDHWGW